MKTLNIEIPKGYEIDKEKSTFEKIVFKEIKNELPKSWEELGEIKGYYVSSASYIHPINKTDQNGDQRNVFDTKEQAEASIALAQLSQLKKVYNGDWTADWSNIEQSKYCIQFDTGFIRTSELNFSEKFLSFKDTETRDLFLENFRDLIEKAKPLMS